MELNENYLKGLINGAVNYHLITGGISAERLKALNLSWSFESIGKDKKVICKFVSSLYEVERYADTDRGTEQWTELHENFDDDYFIVSEHDTDLKFSTYVFEIMERLDNIKIEY